MTRSETLQCTPSSTAGCGCSSAPQSRTEKGWESGLKTLRSSRVPLPPGHRRRDVNILRARNLEQERLDLVREDLRNHAAFLLRLNKRRSQKRCVDQLGHRVEERLEPAAVFARQEMAQATKHSGLKFSPEAEELVFDVQRDRSEDERRAGDRDRRLVQRALRVHALRRREGGFGTKWCM